MPMPANAAGAVAASHRRAGRLLAGCLVAMPATPAAGAATGASDAQRAGQKAAQNDGQKANSQKASKPTSQRAALKQAQAHSAALTDSASVQPSAGSIRAKSRNRGSKRHPGTSGLNRHHRASGMQHGGPNLFRRRHRRNGAQRANALLRNRLPSARKRQPVTRRQPAVALQIMSLHF